MNWCIRLIDERANQKSGARSVPSARLCQLAAIHAMHSAYNIIAEGSQFKHHIHSLWRALGAERAPEALGRRALGFERAPGALKSHSSDMPEAHAQTHTNSYTSADLGPPPSRQLAFTGKGLPMLSKHTHKS